MSYERYIIRNLKMVSFLFLSTIFSSLANGDVVDSSEYGFTVRNTARIDAPPAEVYRHLVTNIGKWWDPSHTFSGNSENLYIEDKANGCFCELLDGGGSVRHLVVVHADPGRILRMAGGLGPLQSFAITGSLTFSLSENDNGTDVELTYAVAGYYPIRVHNWASPVDRVLFIQLKRLKEYIEKELSQKELPTGEELNDNQTLEDIKKTPRK